MNYEPISDICTTFSLEGQTPSFEKKKNLLNLNKLYIMKNKHALKKNDPNAKGIGQPAIIAKSSESNYNVDVQKLSNGQKAKGSKNSVGTIGLPKSL